MALSRRIKAGKHVFENNPNLHEVFISIRDSPRDALKMLKNMPKKTYLRLKNFINFAEAVLPPEYYETWKLLEALYEEDW